MKKLFLMITVIIFTANIFSQPTQRLTATGGLLLTQTTINGHTASIEYEKPLNDSLSLYIYTGIISWGQNKITPGTSPAIQFYTEDDHIIYPVYVGAHIYLSAIKPFDLFFDLELGYNYFEYNSYSYTIANNPFLHGETEYLPDYTRKKRVSEQLLGVGFGLRLLYPITKYLGLNIELKRNTLYQNFYDIQTNYSFNSGLYYNI